MEQSEADESNALRPSLSISFFSSSLRLARQCAQLLCFELCQLLLPVHLDDERHDEHQERRRRDPRRLARRAGELPRGVRDGGGCGLERGQGKLGEGGHVREREGGSGAAQGKEERAAKKGKRDGKSELRLLLRLPLFAITASFFPLFFASSTVTRTLPLKTMLAPSC